MYRLIPLLPALVFATSAFAQTVPEGTHQDLWCGTALNIVLVAPEGATAEDLASIARYLDGANQLLDRGAAAMLAAGFTQAAVDKAKADLLEPVGRQVADQEPAEFSPDECTLLIEAILPPPAESSESSEPAASSAPAQ